MSTTHPATDARSSLAVSRSSGVEAVAILIPCFNEEIALPSVIADFREALPDATIYVYDNNSTDGTSAVIARANVVGRRERRQGKGHVIRRMFADIEADIYVLVDGDNTYDAAAAPAMVSYLLTDQLDMVTGTRVPVVGNAYRPGHKLGNRVITGLVGVIFGHQLSDMLSGYRVFSRRFVKSFPALSSGFETETELTVHALELRMPIGEVSTLYRERPAGSTSKLRTYSDGWRILKTIAMLIKEERPLQLFTLAGLVLLACGIGLGVPVIAEFIQTQTVPRLPTAVLATGFVLLSCLSTFVGLILDSVSRGRKEIKRLAYLTIPFTRSRPTDA